MLRRHLRRALAAPASGRTVDGTFWGTAAEAVAVPTGLFTVAYLTRQFGPDGYGLYALVISLITWAEVLLASFLYRASVKFVSERGAAWEDVGATVIRMNAVIGVAGAAAVIAFAPALAGALGEPSLVGPLRLFALDIPLKTLVSAHEQVLVGIGRYRVRAALRSAWWVGRLALIVALVEAGLSLDGAVLGCLGATALSLAIGRAAVRPSLWRERAYPMRPILAYAVPLFVSGIALHALKYLDLFALKALGRTAAEAGFYAAGKNLAALPDLVMVAFVPLLLATLSRAVHTSSGPLAKDLGRDALRIPFLLLPFLALAAGAAPGLVDIVYGPSFESAGPLMAILLGGAAASLTLSVASTVLVAIGRPRIPMVVSLPLLGLTVGGFVVVVPEAGAVGAAAVSALVMAVGALAMLGIVRAVWGVAPPLLTVVRTSVIAAAAYGAAAAVPVGGVLLIGALAGLAVVAVGLLVGSGEVRSQEVDAVRQLVPSFGRRSPAPSSP